MKFYSFYDDESKIQVDNNLMSMFIFSNEKSNINK